MPRRSLATRIVAPAVLGLLAAVLALTGALEGNAAEPTRTHSFAALADAYVSSTDRGANFGSHNIMLIDSANPVSASRRTRGYVRFQVEGLNDPVTAAVLRLYVTDKGNDAIEARNVVGTSWGESDVTWDDSPATPDDVVDSTDATDAGTWVSLDVAPLVRGNGEVSIVLTSSSSAPMAVSSREGQRRQELVVTTSATSPRNEVAPTISGRPQTETLVAEPGSWTGSTPMTYTYEWQRCNGAGEDCAAIAGRTASHELGSHDVGSTLRVKVVASNGAGSTDATSAPTAVVAPATGQPPPLPPPTPPGDNEPPNPPGNPTVVARGETRLDLTWDSSADNVGVTSYGVLVDGTQVATVAVPMSRVDGLVCGTTYVVDVYASDAAGNRSPEASLDAETAACSSSTPPPPSPPSPPPPPGTRPRPRLRLGSPSRRRARRASRSPGRRPRDNVGVTGYGLYKDGAAVRDGSAACGSTVSGLACGTAYTFEVDAYDAAGNRSTRASVIGSTAACADTQAPTRAGERRATLAHGDEHRALLVGLDRQRRRHRATASTAGARRPARRAATTGIFSGLACNTNYTLAVDAYDAAGNRSREDDGHGLDHRLPGHDAAVHADRPRRVERHPDGLTLTWNASTDNVGVTGYDVYRNGTKMATVTSTSSSQTGLACGTSYTFGVVARDAAGNSSPQAQLNASTSACPAPPPPPPPPPPSGEPGSHRRAGISKTWGDEFDALSDTSWGQGIWYNPGAPANSIYVQNGTLNLVSRRSQGYPEVTLTTEGANQPATFTLGYFEARMRWTKGPGAWPAFWLLSYRHAVNPAYPSINPFCSQNSLSNPFCYSAELDVFEGQGTEPTVYYGTSHRNSCSCCGVNNTQNSNNYTNTNVDLTAGFHTYGMLWTSTGLSWYLDGQLLKSTPVYDSTNQPMFLLLQMWIGGWTSGTSAQTPDELRTEVDWVRVAEAGAAGGVGEQHRFEPDCSTPSRPSVICAYAPRFTVIAPGGGADIAGQS